MSDQKEQLYLMWRGIVAMAHADHKLVEEERDYLETVFSKIKLDEPQKAQLIKEIEEPQPIDDILPQLQPAYRAQIIHFARMLAFKDGIKATEEDVFLQKMQEYARGKIDMDSLRAEIRAEVQSAMTAHEAGIDAKRPTGPLSTLVNHISNALGIDLMD